MDKGLEKINFLNIKLNTKKENLALLEKIISEKEEEKEELEIEKNILNITNESIVEEKNEVENCTKNIKKAKRNKHITTICSIIILELLSIILTKTIMSAALMTDMPKYIILIHNIYIIPLSIMFGDVSNYRYKKKYLKKHKLENVEKGLEENLEKINANNKQMNVVENQLEILNNDKNKLVLEIENLEKEIEKINLIRKDIIDAFIEDNKALNNLLNAGYEIYVEEKEKQLIKE